MIRESQTRLRESILPRMGVAPPSLAAGWGVLAPDWVDLRFDAARRREVVQQLRDLGYLPGPGGIVEDPALTGALETFYAERRSLQFQFAYAPDADFAAPVQAAADAVLRRRLSDSLQVKFVRLRELQGLTALDGLWRLRSLPRQGERSLASRVIQYRLRVFNLLETPAPEGVARYRKAEEASLDRLGALLDLSAPTPGELNACRCATVDLLGSAAVLADRYRTIFGAFTLVFPRPEAGRARARHRIFGGPRRPRRSARRPRTAKTSDREAAREPWNLLGLEILQVLLWIDGYYEGEIDHDWGPLSQEAFDAACAGEALERSSLVQEGVGFWRIDGAAAIAALKHTAGTARDVYAEQDRILEGLEAAMETTPELRTWPDVEAAVANRNAAIDAEAERRQYLGVGALVRALRRLGAWVRDAFDRFVGFLRRMVGPVLQFVRFVGKGLKRALELADLALERLVGWISGDPWATLREDGTALLLTGSDLDGDTLNLALGPLDAATRERHYRGLEGAHRALGVILSIAVQLVKGALTGGLGWFGAARRIFQIVRDALEEDPGHRFAGAMLWS